MSLVKVPVHFHFLHPITSVPAPGRVSLIVPRPIRDPGGDIVYHAVEDVQALVNGEVTFQVPATDQPGFSSAGYVTIHIVVNDPNNRLVVVFEEKRNVGIPYDYAGTMEYSDLPPVAPATAMGIYASYESVQDLEQQVAALGGSAYENKGDLFVGTGEGTFVVLPAGANDQVLIADSAQTSGLKYGLPAIANISGLQTALDGKSPTNHTHPVPTPTVVLSDAPTIVTDAALGTRFRVTLGGNRALGNPTGATDGQTFLWEIIQDGVGGRILTLGNKFTYGTDLSSVQFSTTPGKRDFLGAIYNATEDKFYILAFGRGY